MNLHCVVHKPFCVYHFVVEARISMRFWLIMHGKIPRWSHESGHSVCCWCYSSCILHILEIIIIYKWISSIIIIIFYIYTGLLIAQKWGIHWTFFPGVEGETNEGRRRTSERHGGDAWAMWAAGHAGEEYVMLSRRAGGLCVRINSRESDGSIRKSQVIVTIKYCV